jgi:hypothetical protein
MRKTWPVITFDFDGTIKRHGFDPEDGCFTRDCGLDPQALHAIRTFAEEGISVHIVTSRRTSTRSEVEEFVVKHNLSQFISNIHFTNGELKKATLARLGSMKHFDDDPAEIKALPDNIVGILWRSGHLDENNEVCDPDDPHFHFDNWND